MEFTLCFNSETRILVLFFETKLKTIKAPRKVKKKPPYRKPLAPLPWFTKPKSEEVNRVREIDLDETADIQLILTEKKIAFVNYSIYYKKNLFEVSYFYLFMYYLL